MEIETERDFHEKVLQSEVPVIVDFYAHWCGPCHSLGPLLEDVASVNKGKMELVKVNVDILPDLALQYQVSAIPAVAGVRGGEVVSQFVGLKDVHFLKEFAHNLVSSPDPLT